MKKKFLAMLVALACVITLTFGLAACGNKGDNPNSSPNGSVASGDTTGGNSSTGGGNTEEEAPHELTDAEWEAAFDYTNYTNFTETSMMKMVMGEESEEQYSRIKFDVPNKRVEQSGYTLDATDNEVILHKDILAKEDDKYVSYYYNVDTENWSKMPEPDVNDEAFAGEIEMYFTSMTMIGDKTAYTYNDGVYTADVVSVEPFPGYTVEMIDVEITFAGGRIKTMGYTSVNPDDATQKMVYSATFTDFGTTVIELPTNIAEGEEGELAGNTFYFYDMVCDTLSEEELAPYRAMISNMTIYFGTDGTATVTMTVYFEGLPFETIQSGTYVQDGDSVTITIDSQNIGGVDMPMEDTIEMYATFDGVDLSVETEIDEDNMAYTILRVM